MTHKRCREEDNFDAISDKRLCRGRRDASDHYPSFYTTVYVFLADGMARVTKCCIDSGYESSGRHGNINPSVVEKMGLVPYRDYTKFTLADGSIGRHNYAVNVPLTFVTQSGAVTVDTILHVNKRDVQSQSILLGTGVLNALGGMHDHRSNPSAFFITDPSSGEMEILYTDARSAKPTAAFLLKNDMDYVFELVSTPAFAKMGAQAFPKIAWTKIGTSREIYAQVALKEDGGATLSAKAKKQFERLVQTVAEKEYKTYLKLWRADIEDGIIRTPREYGQEVDDQFTPEWS